MNIRNIVQSVFRTTYLSVTMAFISCLSADQSMFMATTYSTPSSKDVSSITNSFYQTPAYKSDNKETEFAFKKRIEINEERIGSFIYKTIDDPKKIRNQIAGSALLYGLDSIGLGDTMREGIYFIKKNTRYSFGDCGEVRLKTNKITAGSCLPDGGSVELNSSYNFNSVQLQFTWPL